MRVKKVGTCVSCEKVKKIDMVERREYMVERRAYMVERRAYIRHIQKLEALLERHGIAVPV